MYKMYAHGYIDIHFWCTRILQDIGMEFHTSFKMKRGMYSISDLRDNNFSQTISHVNFIFFHFQYMWTEFTGMLIFHGLVSSFGVFCKKWQKLHQSSLKAPWKSLFIGADDYKKTNNKQRLYRPNCMQKQKFFCKRN